MTVHGRGAQLGREICGVNTKRAQGWCPRAQRLWGGLPHPAPIWKSPSLHQCPHFDWSLHKDFRGLDTPKKPQLLNFWPALSY